MRFGIIGCGLIGGKRAAALAGHDIVLVADRDPAAAERLAQASGAGIARDWQALAAAGLDAVIVATAPDMQSRIACACLENGAHVLIEKPAGRDVAEASTIASAAARAGRVVKVGFNHRFHPALARARELVTQDAVGTLLFVRGRYGHGGRPGYAAEWRMDPAVSGGGEAVDQGAHLIDLARWFLGDLTLAYGAAPAYFWKPGVDDNCFVALSGPAGQMAWLHAGWTEWKNLFSLEIMGRDGKLAIDGLGGSYGVERLTYYRMLPGMGPPETTSWEFPFPDTSWQRELAAFIAAIGGAPSTSIADIADSVATHEIIGGVYGLKPVKTVSARTE